MVHTSNISISQGETLVYGQNACIKDGNIAENAWRTVDCHNDGVSTFTVSNRTYNSGLNPFGRCDEITWRLKSVCNKCKSHRDWTHRTISWNNNEGDWSWTCNCRQSKVTARIKTSMGNFYKHVVIPVAVIGTVVALGCLAAPIIAGATGANVSVNVVVGGVSVLVRDTASENKAASRGGESRSLDNFKAEAKKNPETPLTRVAVKEEKNSAASAATTSNISTDHEITKIDQEIISNNCIISFDSKGDKILTCEKKFCVSDDDVANTGKAVVTAAAALVFTKKLPTKALVLLFTNIANAESQPHKVSVSMTKSDETGQTSTSISHEGVTSKKCAGPFFYSTDGSSLKIGAEAHNTEVGIVRRYDTRETCLVVTTHSKVQPSPSDTSGEMKN